MKTLKTKLVITLFVASVFYNINIVAQENDSKIGLRSERDSNICKAMELIDAVKNGDFEKMKVLLSSNLDLINSQDDFGATPLHWAGIRGHVKISKYLIKNGADVNMKENHGGTPLHWAAHFDYTNVIRALISKGVKVDEQNIMERTALHAAARRGCLEVVKVLIELKADINAQTKQDQTALHIAAQYGHEEVYNLLLSEGALKEIKDENGKVPSELYYERPKPIQIDRKNYENYIGKYERQHDGRILEISRENKKLFYISLVLDELYPIAEHKFMSKSELFQITFVINENNEVVEMKYNDRGRGFTARKVNMNNRPFLTEVHLWCKENYQEKSINKQ